MKVETEVERVDEEIHVTFTGQFDIIVGYQESKEDLGLNPAGPDPVDGLEIVSEEPKYYDEDEQEHISGYTEAVFAFEDEDALDAAKERLYSIATVRFEWGMAKEGKKVQDFAGAIPSHHDVPEQVEA